METSCWARRLWFRDLHEAEGSWNLRSPHAMRGWSHPSRKSVGCFKLNRSWMLDSARKELELNSCQPLQSRMVRNSCPKHGWSLHLARKGQVRDKTGAMGLLNRWALFIFQPVSFWWTDNVQLRKGGNRVALTVEDIRYRYINPFLSKKVSRWCSKS